MTRLTVGALRDIIANLPADMNVNLSMDMDLVDNLNAVYVSGIDTLVFDNVTSGLGAADGTSVLFNAFA